MPTNLTPGQAAQATGKWWADPANVNDPNAAQNFANLASGYTINGAPVTPTGIGEALTAEIPGWQDIPGASGAYSRMSGANWPGRPTGTPSGGTPPSGGGTPPSGGAPPATYPHWTLTGGLTPDQDRILNQVLSYFGPSGSLSYARNMPNTLAGSPAVTEPGIPGILNRARTDISNIDFTDTPMRGALLRAMGMPTINRETGEVSEQDLSNNPGLRALRALQETQRGEFTNRLQANRAQMGNLYSTGYEDEARLFERDLSNQYLTTAAGLRQRALDTGLSQLNADIARRTLQAQAEIGGLQTERGNALTNLQGNRSALMGLAGLAMGGTGSALDRAWRDYERRESQNFTRSLFGAQSTRDLVAGLIPAGVNLISNLAPYVRDLFRGSPPGTTVEPRPDGSYLIRMPDGRTITRTPAEIDNYFNERGFTPQSPGSSPPPPQTPEGFPGTGPSTPGPQFPDTNPNPDPYPPGDTDSISQPQRSLLDLTNFGDTPPIPGLDPELWQQIQQWQAFQALANQGGG